MNTLLAQALKIHNQGDYSGAAEIYETLCRDSKSTEYPDALHLLGLCRLHQNDLDEALNLINQAIALKPNTAVYYGNRGNVYRRLNQFEKAKQDYERALGLVPNFIDALQNYASLLHKMGEHQKAIKKYRRLLELVPGHAQATIALSEILFVQGDTPEAVQGWEEAIIALQEVLKKNPDHFEAWHTLAQLFFSSAAFAKDKRKMYLMAAGAFQEALRLQPDNVQIFNNLGCCYKDAGLLQKSVEIFRKLLEQTPDYPPALHNLANTLHAQGEIEPCLDYARRLIEVQKGEDIDTQAMVISSYLFSFLAIEHDFYRAMKEFNLFSEVAAHV